MLILTRKAGESLYIGDQVKVTIMELKGNQVRVGIDAPSTMKIYREEIYRQILEENQQAAQGMGTELPEGLGDFGHRDRAVVAGVRSLKNSRTVSPKELRGKTKDLS
jgi:carbon storage regulator